MSNEAPAASAAKFNLRGPLFRTRVRNEVEAALSKKNKGLTGAARTDRLMNDVTDALIDEATDLVTGGRLSAEAENLAGAMPVGGILDWFRENKDLIAKVVALILAALGL